MKLNDILPKQAQASLGKELEQDESVLYSLRSDLSEDRQYGDTYLVATARRVAVLSEDSVITVMPFSEITEIKVEELFSSSCLVAVTEKGEKCLIYYSKSFVPEFAVFSRVLNDLRENRKPELPDEHEAGHCPKCGSQLPERGASCPRCIYRFKTLGRLLKLVRPYRFKVILLVMMTGVTVSSELVPPYITKELIDHVLPHGYKHQLFFWIALMAGCFTVFLGSRLIGSSLMAWLGARIVSDLRAKLHRALQQLTMSYHDRRESGQIISRVMHDTAELQHFLIDGMSYFLVECVQIVAISAILICLDAKLALLVFVPIPFLVGGGAWFWKKLIPLFHKQGTRMGALHSILGESIKGVKTIKAFSREKSRESEFDGINEQLFGIRYGLERTFVGFSEIMFWIMRMGLAAVWFLGGIKVFDSGELTVGTLVAFAGYMWLLYGPLQWFTAILNWMTHAFAGAERIFAVLDSRQEIYDAPDAISVPEMKGAISFDDVHFSYERGKEVVKGISFDIKQGEMIGLVGKSGVGKSTIINLICRFYDIDSGSIMLDGHPINRIKLEQLRRQIGMVMQDPFLFNASILENIGYGTEDAAFADVVRAAKAANAHDFILDKENGYDTIVGERGVKLSGGEKQRLSIARAILHNPPILILDEATSSVDTETEKEIQQAISRLIEGRTTIGIAHRLSTLRNAHRLIVIDDGKIAEIGSHAELIEKNGIYAKLVSLQSELSKVRGDIWQE